MKFKSAFLLSLPGAIASFVVPFLLVRFLVPVPADALTHALGAGAGGLMSALVSTMIALNVYAAKAGKA